MVQNCSLRRSGEEREWYHPRRHHSVPCRRIEIQTTPLQGYPVITSAHEPIMVVTRPRVAEKFKIVIYTMTDATVIKLIHLLQPENANLAYEDLNTCLDEPQNR
jgi:hypothetical protein